MVSPAGARDERTGRFGRFGRSGRDETRDDEIAGNEVMRGDEIGGQMPRSDEVRERFAQIRVERHAVTKLRDVD